MSRYIDENIVCTFQYNNALIQIGKVVKGDSKRISVNAETTRFVAYEQEAN